MLGDGQTASTDKRRTDRERKKIGHVRPHKGGEDNSTGDSSFGMYWCRIIGSAKVRNGHNIYTVCCDVATYLVGCHHFSHITTWPTATLCWPPAKRMRFFLPRARAAVAPCGGFYFFCGHLVFFGIMLPPFVGGSIAMRRRNLVVDAVNRVHENFGQLEDLLFAVVVRFFVYDASGVV